VIGLDGASFDVIEPLRAAGRLPNLDALLREGGHARLASTVPPMTFPSWSTFLTGLGPGRHGVFDFTQKLPGQYRLRFSNATDRHGPSLFRRVNDAGGRVLALGMPATFPPEPVDGLLVCGFDSPVSSGTDGRMASDPALYAALAARVGPWMRPDLDEAAASDGWHERALDVLLGRIERKTAFALSALEELRGQGRGPELCVVIFSESDTVAHHFWRDHDPASPRHDPAASARRRGAVAAVYERLDQACGALREAFGTQAACFVVSDHGAGGAARRVVHLNRRLQECELLTPRSARDLALRVLPPRAAQALFRRVRPAAARLESAARFGGIDWSRTLAFSEEANTQPGVWINLQGREARGCVAPADYEAVRDRLLAALRDWKLPEGGPVVARARRREEVYSGPFLERAPDVVVELALEAGYALSLVPTPWSESPESLRWLEDHELAGGRGRGMNGTHRPDGIWIQCLGGPDEAQAVPADATIADCAPTILAAMGIPWVDAADGSALAGVRHEYSAEEDALVAERLRRLGYLE
jgi:predicted AlkP superfamily phosphohydrolase/phosphomutase